MKRLLSISCLMAVIACSPDQRLVEQNELLKAQAEEIKQVALEQTANARKAEADALEQKRMAEEIMLMAKFNEAEANRQKAIAEEAKRQADKLAKQLEACQ